MGRIQPESGSEIITEKGPRGMNKRFKLIQGELSDTDPKLSDEQRVQALIDLIGNIPPVNTQKHTRRGKG